MKGSIRSRTETKIILACGRKRQTEARLALPPQPLTANGPRFLGPLPPPLPAAESGNLTPTERAALLHEWEEHEARLLDSGMPEDGGFELPGTMQIPPADKTVAEEVGGAKVHMAGMPARAGA